MLLFRALFRSRSLHTITTVCCLLTGTIAAVLLYLDLTGSGLDGTGRVVAEAISVEGRAKRRAPATYLWNGISGGSKLRKRESVQTGPESSVELRFRNGDALTIGENSLVVLDDSAAVNLKFLRGTFLLQSGSEERKISAVEGEEAKVVELPFRPLEPRNGMQFFVKEADGTEHHDVVFQWKWLKVTPGATLQVSRDRYFRRAGLEKIPLEAAKSLHGLPLPPGSYYWRLALPGGNGSETRRFEILGVRPLISLGPVSGEKAYSARTGLKFRWTVPPKKENWVTSGKHWLELSLEKDFAKVLKREEIAAARGEVAVAEVPLGALYWRLVSIYGDVSLESDAVAFEHEGKRKPSVALILPAANQAAEFPGGPRFEWSLDGEADQFVFEIANRISGNIVHSERTVYPNGHWKKAKPGQYRWRVSAGEHNKLLADSPWRELTILAGTIPTVSPGAKVLMSYDTDVKVPFAWKVDSLAAGRSFYLEVSENDAFDSLLIKNEGLFTTFEPDPSLLKPNRYFWRVSERDAEGNVFRQSRLRTVEVAFPPPIPTPTAAEPSVGYSFRGRSAKRMAFHWSPVDHARAYEFLLMKGQDRIYQKTTKDLRVVLQGIKPGTYTWTVAGIDRWDRRGDWLSPRDCTVDYGPRLGAPSVGASLPAPRARRRGASR